MFRQMSMNLHPSKVWLFFGGKIQQNSYSYATTKYMYSTKKICMQQKNKCTQQKNMYAMRVCIWTTKQFHVLQKYMRDNKFNNIYLLMQYSCELYIGVLYILLMQKNMFDISFYIYGCFSKLIRLR